MRCFDLVMRIRFVSLPLAIFTAAAILAGCNDTGKQKSLAIDGAKQFQALYNNGACQQVYENSSSYFQSHEKLPRWLRDCTELRARFGDLREFRPTENNAWPIGKVGIVWVQGTAEFVNGPADLRLDFDLANEQPALFDVLIKAGPDQTAIPGFTGEVRN